MPCRPRFTCIVVFAPPSSSEMLDLHHAQYTPAPVVRRPAAAAPLVYPLHARRHPLHPVAPHPSMHISYTRASSIPSAACMHSHSSLHRCRRVARCLCRRRRRCASSRQYQRRAPIRRRYLRAQLRCTSSLELVAAASVLRIAHAAMCGRVSVRCVSMAPLPSNASPMPFAVHASPLR
jgi:hypothetical protein